MELLERVHAPLQLQDPELVARCAGEQAAAEGLLGMPLSPLNPARATPARLHAVRATPARLHAGRLTVPGS